MKRNSLKIAFVAAVVAAQFAVAGPQPTERAASILFVVDNSQSLSGVRENLQRAFGKFSDYLAERGIRYQLAVTTTDYFSQNGKLVATPAGKRVIDSRTDSAATEFDALLGNVRETPTSFWEQGLESSRAAIEQHGFEFLEKGVPLNVIYVTDEDDYSCGDKCFGSEPENNPNWVAYPLSRYVDLFARLRQNQDIRVAVYPVVGLPAGTCATPSFGKRYLTVLEKTGAGVSTSICPSQVENSLMKIVGDIAAQFE